MQKYLDATRDLHGGWGYDEFAAATEDNVLQPEIARKMKVNRVTIGKWQKIYNREEATK